MPSAIQSWVLSLMRIMLAFTFTQHGFQKLFGFFGGVNGQGASAEAFSLFWFAGLIESIGGPLMLLGIFTRPVAVVLSGQMAVAYFLVHHPMGFWPVVNHGELAFVYCFAFLYLWAAGPGPFSLDRLRSR